MIVRRSQPADSPLTSKDSPGVQADQGASPRTVRKPAVSTAQTLSVILIDMAHRELDRLPPCVGSDGWTSDDRDERALAARCCAGCPLLDLCAKLADEYGATFGVWAGRDYGPKATT